jgi:hypothetical protein
MRGTVELEEETLVPRGGIWVEAGTHVVLPRPPRLEGCTRGRIPVRVCSCGERWVAISLTPEAAAAASPIPPIHVIEGGGTVWLRFVKDRWTWWFLHDVNGIEAYHVPPSLGFEGCPESMRAWAVRRWTWHG